MNQEKILSVIIPIYNAENYLTDIFKCFNEWSNQNIEIILVNDGSKDDSLKLCKEKEKMDNRFIVIDKPNEGIAKARNRGLSFSHGKYVYFCDQDDYVDTNILDEIIEKLEDNECDFCISNYSIVLNGEKKDKIIIKENKIFDRENSIELIKWLIGTGVISYSENIPQISSTIWNCVFRKEFIIKNNITFRKYIDYEDDWLFLIDCLLCSNRLFLNQSILYYWKVNCKSESHTHKYVKDFYRNRKLLKKEIDSILNKINISIKDKYDFAIMFQRRTLLWNLFNECYSNHSLNIKIQNIKTTTEEENAKYKMIKGNSKKENILVWLLLSKKYYLAYFINKYFFKFYFH